VRASERLWHCTAPNGSTYVNYQDDDECIDDAFEPGAVMTGGDAGPAAGHNSRLDSSSTGYASTRGAAATYTRCIALYGFQVRPPLSNTLTFRNVSSFLRNTEALAYFVKNV